MGESGKLECEYCGSNFEAAEIEVLYADKEEKAAAAMQAAEEGEAGRRAADYDSDWDTSGLSGDWGAENDNMRSYSCPSCGAELICDSCTIFLSASRHFASACCSSCKACRLLYALLALIP